MRHLAAYLLLVAGGNATPSAEDVTKLLAASNIAVDEERLNQLISDVEGIYLQRNIITSIYSLLLHLGKDIEEIIAKGRAQLVPLSSGVAAAPAAGGAAPAAAAAEAPKKEEKKKEEVVDALEGGMNMFGGGGGGDY